MAEVSLGGAAMVQILAVGDRRHFSCRWILHQSCGAQRAGALVDGVC